MPRGFQALVVWEVPVVEEDRRNRRDRPAFALRQHTARGRRASQRLPKKPIGKKNGWNATGEPCSMCALARRWSGRRSEQVGRNAHRCIERHVLLSAIAQVFQLNNAARHFGFADDDAEARAEVVGPS